MEETIIVIGGLSAGPAAAAKARRNNEFAKILLFEQQNDVSYATCGIPYALSGKIASRDDLIVVSSAVLEKRFDIDLHLNERVIGVNIDAKTVETAKGHYSYDRLIYAAGAAALVPPIKNLGDAKNWSTVRTLEDFDRLSNDTYYKEARHIIVLGGGLIGVEVAENLRSRGVAVTIVEAGKQILPQWSPVFAGFAMHALTRHDVSVVTGQRMQSVVVADGVIEAFTLEDGIVHECDYVIVAAGIRPNTKMLLEHGAEALANGALIVDKHMKTSLPDVFAAGDCVAITNQQTGKPDYFPLGTHSNKGGRAAGGGGLYLGGYGTAIIKVFDTVMGRTGLAGKDLDQGIYNKAYINAPSTPGYYPNSTNMAIEIAYHKESHIVVAAELVGEVGVDKRLDVLATAIFAKLTIDDLTQLDLAYAPPFSPAKDPVVVAGFVAGNQENSSYQAVTATQLNTEMKTSSPLIIDVRTQSEREHFGAIEGGLHIELDSLRDAVVELDVNKDVVVYCEKGIRGYLAAMILQQRGFKSVRNLAGGHLAWRMIEECR